MSKASRRQQRQAKTQSGAAGSTPPGASATPGASTPSAPATTPAAGATTANASATPRANTSPTGTPRVGRRPQQRMRYQQPTWRERYRGLIILIAAIGGIALIGTFVFFSASQPLFACSALFDPAPTPTPAAGASPQPGYVQDDMGRKHVTPGTNVKYTYCAPASGPHFNAAGQGPITPRLYGPEDQTIPQGWVHNLEHGALVVLYRGDSEGATPDGQKALRALFDGFPNSPVCDIAPGTIQGPVITRFDQMATPFAALVWGRYLPLQTFDQAAILDFYDIWGERTNPEPLCQRTPPTASPSPEASPDASASPSASASPAASASVAPSPSAEASPSASAGASPSTEASPDASPSASPAP